MPSTRSRSRNSNQARATKRDEAYDRGCFFLLTKKNKNRALIAFFPLSPPLHRRLSLSRRRRHLQFFFISSSPSAPAPAPPSSPASRQTLPEAGRSPPSAREHLQGEGVVASFFFSFDVEEKKEEAAAAATAASQQRHSSLPPDVFFSSSFCFFVVAQQPHRPSEREPRREEEEEEKESERAKREREREKGENTCSQSLLSSSCLCQRLPGRGFFFTLRRSFFFLFIRPSIECSSRTSLEEPRSWPS